MHRPSLIGALVRVSSALLLAGGAIACGGPSEEDLHRAQAEYHLGVGLMHEGNLAGAFEHLQESVRLDADNAEAHFLLGTLYLGRQDFPASERHLRESLRANAALGSAGTPDLNGQARNSLGVLYVLTHRHDEAIAELRLAAEDLMYHTPDLAWLNIGWAYLEMRDYPSALEALGQATTRNPLSCNAWYRTGQAHVALGESAAAEAQGEHFLRAEEALTHALEIEDERCQALQDAWRVRGEIRARLGRREDASSDLERCIELSRETESGRACAAFLNGDAFANRDDQVNGDGFLEASP